MTCLIDTDTEKPIESRIAKYSILLFAAIPFLGQVQTLIRTDSLQIILPCSGQKGHKWAFQLVPYELHLPIQVQQKIPNQHIRIAHYPCSVFTFKLAAVQGRP